MHILEMQAAYGRLRGDSLRLEPGLNLIYAPNESGKSTWCSFIRTMLYGLPTRQSGPLADKNRFAPWTGEAMQGRMDLKTGGQRWTVLRDTRRASAPMQNFACTYTGTAQPVPEVNGQNLGETLLGVPREVFQRSAFIGQSGLAVSQDPELERRIAALLSTGQEDVSYSESYDRLKKQLNRRRHNKTGLIPQLEQEQARLDDALRRQAELTAQLENAREQQCTAQTRVEELEQRRAQWEALEKQEAELDAELHKRMLVIPQMIDDSVPLGPDDSYNVEVQRFGECKVPDFEIPYHVDIMESFNGIDLDAAGRVSGSGFYYLLGDIARLHEAVLAYGRDFMIGKGFTYCIPPFMIHGNVVEGVMSQTDMDGMMYKIEGEDLYLIGTSEHSMIGRFIDQILPAESLPQTLTSYSPCFRKEKGAHGIEERGVYRIHQFEKQEMIVVCKPEDSKEWYEKLWKMSVELFRSMNIPVRQLECCSGDLADLKVKSCDIEAWSPRQQKFFEVCSCSNLGDAQARRLRIRYKDENGKMQLCHTLNNTCVAPPRMLIAFLENNLQADGTVVIPEVLRPYMGGTEKLIPNKK